MGICKRCEEAGGTAWFIGHAADSDFSLIALDADAAYDDLLHSCGFFFHDGSWVVVKTAADFKGDSKFFGKFDGA